jgi:hypothetical protein
VEYRAAIDRSARERGRPTLLRLMLAYSPPAQKAMNDLYYPVAQNGRVSRRLEESLLVAACDARVCRYCVGGHSLFLVNEFGYDQDAVRQMRSGGRHDGRTDAEPPYWSDDEIVEAPVMASHSAWTTTVAQVLHLEDDLGTPEFAGYLHHGSTIPQQDHVLPCARG